jgi:hypothetical protein
MQKYKSLLTCPSILPNIHIYDYLLSSLHCTAIPLSVLQFMWPTCTFSVFNRHIKPFRVIDDSTHRQFVKLLIIIIVGYLFTADHSSTAVALEREVGGREQWCCWRFKSIGMICCFFAWIIPDVLKDLAAVFVLPDPEDDTMALRKVRNLLTQRNNTA